MAVRFQSSTTQPGLPGLRPDRTGSSEWSRFEIILAYPGWRRSASAGFAALPARMGWNNVVHRESNPTGQRATAVIARAGKGVPTVNVERPDPLVPRD